MVHGRSKTGRRRDPDEEKSLEPFLLSARGGGRQGLDLVFFNPATERFAVVEAKAGSGIKRLATYRDGLRQGSFGYIESRLQRYLTYSPDQRSANLVRTLLGEVRAGRLESYATFYRGGRTYELPLDWPAEAAIPR